MIRTVIPVESLTQFHELPGLSLRDPWFTMNAPEPGKVAIWLNNSSIAHKGKRWMSYRTECKRWFMWSKTSLVQLDENLVPIPGTNQMLRLHTRFDGWNAEDARLFVFDNRLHLSYGDGYRMLLAELSNEGEVVRSMAIPSNEPDLNPPHNFPREKNWGFFEYDGRLFCQYRVNPTITAEFNEDWKVINKWETPWKHATKLHGGSPPVFHDNLLWRWVHYHRSEQLPAPRCSAFNGKMMYAGNRYYPHLICFEPEPPFRPVSISEAPVFQTDWEPVNSDGPTPHSVAQVRSGGR